MNELSRFEFIAAMRGLPTSSVLLVINGWLARGDGVAVYRNNDLGHPDIGHMKFLSFGSPEAQLEVGDPPEQLPDMGHEINWRYRLHGVYRGEPINATEWIT